MLYCPSSPCPLACNHRIQRFSATGTFLGTWGSYGSGNGQFERPKGLAIAPDGTVYAADTNNARIQRFSANGAFLSAWGSGVAATGSSLILKAWQSRLIARFTWRMKATTASSTSAPMEPSSARGERGAQAMDGSNGLAAWQWLLTGLFM
jgi:NHL repeat.